MIEIIKSGRLLTMPVAKYRIVCLDCLTEFECDENDCTEDKYGQGWIEKKIACPVCGHTLKQEEENNSLWKCINLEERREVERAIWEQEELRCCLLEHEKKH